MERLLPVGNRLTSSMQPDFNHPIALERIEAGSFGIENNLAHRKS